MDEATKAIKSLPAGYACKCGKFNKFPPYVYAHWDEELTHECECGKTYTILRGNHWQSRKARVSK